MICQVQVADKTGRYERSCREEATYINRWGHRYCATHRSAGDTPLLEEPIKAEAPIRKPEELSCNNHQEQMSLF